MISDLTEECTGANDVSTYLQAVRSLIVSTLACPGMDTLILGVPPDTYKYVRFTVTRVRNMKPGARMRCGNGCTQLGGIAFRKDGVTLNIAMSQVKGGVLGKSPRREQPAQVFEGTLRSKWL